MKIFNRISVYGLIIKIIVISSLFFSTYLEYSFFAGKLFFNLSLLSSIFFNDLIRFFLLKKKFLFFLSLLYSNLMVIYLTVAVNEDILLYFFVLLIEIVYLLNKKIQLTLLIIHFIGYVMIWYGDFNFINDFFSRFYWNIYLVDFFTNTLIYFAIVFVLYLLKKIFLERMEVIRLNEKLKSANKRLRESILEIENLTISKERNRIAQEIHDSIGHSLTGLIMHLEFLQKIHNCNDNKTSEIISRSLNISRDSMSELRKAVYALKEENSLEDFKKSIENMISLIRVEGININLTFNGNVNNLEIELKNIIYKMLKEIITNSLKHGKANDINVEFSISNTSTMIKVIDNGVGCDKIKKGTGLTGIENRVFALGGLVDYKSKNNKGFYIKIVIPL